MTIYLLDVHCPDMVTQADARDALTAMGSSPGYNKAEVDLPNHRLLVTTASQDGGHDIQRCLANAGYPPDEFRVVHQGHHPG